MDVKFEDRKPVSEKVLTRKISKWLKENGIMYIKPRGGPYSVRGVPDYLVFIEGLVYGLEVKSNGRQPTPGQLLWHSELRKNNGSVIIIDSDTAWAGISKHLLSVRKSHEC